MRALPPRRRHLREALPALSLAALLIARLSRSVLATIAAGMVALWVVQAGTALSRRA